MTSRHVALWAFLAFSSLALLAFVVLQVSEVVWCIRDDARWRRRKAIQAIHQEYARAAVTYVNMPGTGVAE